MKTAEELSNLSQGELVAIVLELQKEAELAKKTEVMWMNSYTEVSKKHECLLTIIKSTLELI